MAKCSGCDMGLKLEYDDGVWFHIVQNVDDPDEVWDDCQKKKPKGEGK